jgi:DNA helicase HerA-like ATPase
MLKDKNDGYEIERGVYSYPSVGDIVVVPDQKQLKAIVQNKDSNAKVKIGLSPMAANAPVFINPDKVFGRHIAILGNTGSGKSCSVAGIIRWSLEEARKSVKPNSKLNSRFIILDPNGEYLESFSELGTIRHFQVSLNISEHPSSDSKQLKVPSWMWNSYEWSSIAQASGKTQRPLLRRALREVRVGTDAIDDSVQYLRRFYSSCFIEIKNDLLMGASAYKGKPGKNDFGKKLHSISLDAENDIIKTSNQKIKNDLITLSDKLKTIADKKYKTFQNKDGETVEYYEDFEKQEVEDSCIELKNFIDTIGGLQIYEGPNEDCPVFFKNEDFLNHVDRLIQESNSQQYLDFFLMRVRSILTDARISSVIDTKSKDELTLNDWLDSYIGNKNDDGSIIIIDLSLIPSEILFVIVSVLSRIIFEAHHRYRKQHGKILPSTLVVEEAHNFIKRYESDTDEITPYTLCSQSFEKIAKEGRKFGLGLLISSQRPSELSQTVLSQCNTFLLHRLVNDKDQDMVKKLVPDNMGSILNELPILPTRKAILLGWAAPIPIIVEINNLDEKNRPKSKDPDYWNVWVGDDERDVDWKTICDDWQQDKNC